jgi:hypothetical protein
MATAAKEAGVPVVTGDTKVVERGKGDGVFITTTGVGVCRTASNCPGRSGAAGTMDPGLRHARRSRHGDHGERESLAFEPRSSDTAALHGLIAAMLESGAAIRVLRDPTRGGLATTLNEIAASRVGMMLDEKAVAGESGSCGGLRVPRPGSALCGQRGQAGGDLRAGMTPSSAPFRAALAMRCGIRSASRCQRGDDRQREFMPTMHPFRPDDDAHFGGKRIVDWLTGESVAAHTLAELLCVHPE